MIRVQKGDLVEIRFLDHCEDGDDAMEFIVWGRVEKCTKSSILVHSWTFAKETDGASNSNSDNIKTFTIVKKAILELRKLKVVKP